MFLKVAVLVSIFTIVQCRSINTTNTDVSEVSMEKFRFESLPCSCQDQECGCCITITVHRLDFSQRGCLNFSYNPNELAIMMNVYLNNQSIYQNSLSGRNPPRFCIPLPQFPLLMFCIRMYDIQQLGNNIKVCISLEVRIHEATLLAFSFDCIRFGADGFGLQKPTIPADDIEEDSVDFNKNTTLVTKFTDLTTIVTEATDWTTKYTTIDETTEWTTTDETTLWTAIDETTTPAIAQAFTNI